MTWSFRGWDATGQKGWVYGDLVHSKKILKDEPFLEDRVMVGGYEVVPESVGICTGIKDDDGEMLYDGDICRVTVYERSCDARLFYYDNEGQFLFDGGGIVFPMSFALTCRKKGTYFEDKDYEKKAKA